jgi:predicted GNAT family acetyltransferase
MSCKLTDIPNYNSNVGGRFKRMKFGISSGVDEYNRGNKMVSTASSFSINSDAVTIGSSYNEPGLFYKLTANRTDAGMQVEYFKVTPELRKQGIAVKMHLEAFEDAKRRGLNLISDNTISRPAMAIYMKLKEMGYSVRLSPDARVSTVPSLEGDAQIYTDGGGPVVTVNTATRGNPNPGEPSFIENQYNNNPKENLGGSSYQTVKDEDGYVRLKKNNFKQNLEGVSTYKGVPSAIEDVANAAMDAGYHISLRQDSVIVIVPVPPGNKKIKIKVRDMKEMDELLSILGKNKPEPLVIPDGNDGFTVMPVKKNKDGSSEIIGTIAAERQDVNGAVDYTITVAEMSNGFIGKGRGVELYLTMVEELLKKGVAMGSYGSPDYLSSGGMTTESAMRVWRSIYKNLDKHLEKFPNLKGAISLMPSNEKSMIFHKGSGKLKDGSVEENQYEQDIGSEPAYSIELYPDTYAKNVARSS